MRHARRTTYYKQLVSCGSMVLGNVLVTAGVVSGHTGMYHNQRQLRDPITHPRPDVQSIDMICTVWSCTRSRSALLKNKLASTPALSDTNSSAEPRKHTLIVWWWNPACWASTVWRCAVWIHPSAYTLLGPDFSTWLYSDPISANCCKTNMNFRSSRFKLSANCCPQKRVHGNTAELGYTTVTHAAR